MEVITHEELILKMTRILSKSMYNKARKKGKRSNWENGYYFYQDVNNKWHLSFVVYHTTLSEKELQSFLKSTIEKIYYILEPKYKDYMDLTDCSIMLKNYE